ncbi:MAG: DUF6456 domain-containing protein [Pseudomonadota bacterium]
MIRRDIVRALKVIGERREPLDERGAVVSAMGDDAGQILGAAAISAMISEGLLRRVRGGVERTAEGKAFLRRALSTGADDPYRAQHQHRVVRAIDGSAVAGNAKLSTATANAAESPLAWLATRKGRGGAPLVSDTQRRAGERLAGDFARGHQRSRVTQSWDASGVRGSSRRDGISVQEGASAARSRVERALSAVGPGLNDALVAICCEELGLEAAEKKFGWPARSGKLVLSLALDRLATHYGIGSAAVGSGVGVVHWGTEDYRPKA